MTTVITGWCPADWELYGKRMVETFRQFWPESTRLVAYVERIEDTDCCEQRLISDIQSLTAFIERHRRNPLYCGTAIDQPIRWKERDREGGYCFRYDAVKFARVPFYVRDALIEFHDPDFMIWLDGDTYSHAPVAPGFIEGLIPKDAAVAYLGRGHKWSEVGFLGYRMPAGAAVIERYADIFDNDEFTELSEFHSAFIFDEAVRQLRAEGVVCHDMTPDGRCHVWFQSPLGNVMDHLKGERKVRGYSREHRKRGA